MRIAFDTSDRLVLEEKTTKLAVFLVLAVLAFTFAGFVNLNQTWVLSPWMCFMSATTIYLICRLFIYKTVVDIDAKAGKVSISTTRLDGVVSQSVDLQDVYRASVQVMSQDGRKAFRVGLRMGAHDSAEFKPVTNTFMSGANSHATAAKINAWLSGRVDSSAQPA